MRIGMITGEYPPMQGGVGAYTHILARHIATLGHEVFVLTSPAAHAPTGDSIPTASCPSWGMRVYRCARQWIGTNRLDIVNLQYQTAAFGMSPFIHFLPAALRPFPFVTTFHDLRFPYLFPKAGPLRPWIVRRLARDSTAVIATNHEDATALREHPRAALIPIGSNILQPVSAAFDRAAARANVGILADALLIVFFGLLNQSKGLDTLLRAFADLAAELPQAHLAIIGSLGTSDSTNAAYAAKIEALIAELGIASRITQTGFLPEAQVGELLTASDLVALPFVDGASYRRGSLMAAVRYECAILTTEPAVSIPTFKHGENLWLVPPDDPAALTHALRRLAADADLRARLRTGAAKLARAFDWDEIAAQTLALYQTILTEARRGTRA